MIYWFYKRSYWLACRIYAFLFHLKLLLKKFGLATQVFFYLLLANHRRNMLPQIILQLLSKSNRRGLSYNYVTSKLAFWISWVFPIPAPKPPILLCVPHFHFLDPFSHLYKTFVSRVYNPPTSSFSLSNALSFNRMPSLEIFCWNYFLCGYLNFRSKSAKFNPFLFTGNNLVTQV